MKLAICRFLIEVHCHCAIMQGVSLSRSTSGKSTETRGDAAVAGSTDNHSPCASVPILSPIPSLNSTFYEWHGTEGA